VTYPIDLYELMPAVHRREDAGLAYPLEALLDIISAQAGDLQRDITGLWDDFFIETADEWVIPYIADLVGSTPLHRVRGTWRADVANTINYRRRKGTVAMLEDLAADVTGWGAHVVPFFEELEWAQHLDHLRRRSAADRPRVDRVGTVNLGNLDALDRLGGPFDEVVESIDVRPFEAGRGRHNIRKIGFFLWRLRSNPLVAVTPRASAGHPGGYHFNPLGAAAPLFTNDRREDGKRPSELELPGPIRPLALLGDLDAAAAAEAAAAREAIANGATVAEAAARGRAAGAESHVYGAESIHSLVVAVGDPAGPFGDQAIAASRVTVCDLSTWRLPPPGKDAAIDPRLGRLTLAASAGPGAGEVVRVGFCYGFSGGQGADLGGGSYDRRATQPAPISVQLEEPPYHRVVARVDPGTGPWSSSIAGAVASWKNTPAPAARAVVEIVDSGTYREGDLPLALPAAASLEIRAADGQRPVVEVSRLAVSGGGDSALTIDGLAVMGSALQIGAGMGSVTLRHSTLVPGRAFDPEGRIEHPDADSIVAAADAVGGIVTLISSIVGPVRLPAEGWTLIASDSIVDSPSGGTAVGGPAAAFGPTCDFRRVTVLGDVRVRSILYASDVLFLDRVDVERTQAGCIRFSYVRGTATTPRRYRCQPDLAVADQSAAAGTTAASIRSRLRPRFTSRRYGQPGYAQLADDAAPELKTGGEAEAEIGAFSRVLEAQRIANLRIRLDEYLPAGLEPGLIFAT
jgi:hypothetical protein